MKTGYVKLRISEYEGLILVNDQLRRQRKEQEEKIEELTEALQEKSQAVDRLARTMKHTVEFLEAASPKMEKEWRAYIEVVEEAEKNG